MRIKTIVIILITVLLTVVLMQNKDNVDFSFLWATFRISKLLMLALVAAIGFILGLLVGRPKSVKRLGGDVPDNDTEKSKTSTLSNEDKDYIN
ncbi:MAG: LapA family protein [Sphingobacteriales bacterium]